MNSKLFSIIFSLIIGISSTSLYSLRSQQDLNESYDTEVIHTSTRQILKLSSSKQVQLLTVPDGYSFYSYSQGQCCLQSVFNYYQFPTSPKPYKEDFFFRDGDFDRDHFTSPEILVAQAQQKLRNETSESLRNAFQFTIKERLSIEYLEKSIDNEIPVILLITKGNSKQTGSYVIAIGYDSDNFYFEDPDSIQSIAYLPKATLSKYWKAYIDSQNRWTDHLGITINFTNGRKREIVPTVRPLP